MAFPKIKISDDSGNTVGVTDNRLNVNAYLNATPTIDIGDVSLLLDGTAADYGTGNVNTSGRTLRVTIASDDNHFGAVGAAADADGVIHGQLRYIGDKVNDSLGDISNISTYTSNQNVLIRTTGLAFTTSVVGTPAITVRNDTLANLDGNIASGDYSMLQTNAIGALYVTGESKQSEAVTAYGFGMMGEYKRIDGSALPNTVTEGEAVRIATSSSGIQYACLTDESGASDLSTTITTHLSEIEGAVETIEGAVSGSKMQVDIVSAPTLTINSHAVTNAGTFEVQSNVDDTVYTENDDWAEGSSKHILVGGVNHSNTIASDDTAPIRLKSNGSIYVAQESSYRIISSGSIGHDITGGADGVTVVSSAGIDVVLGGDVACKKIDIQAQTDNTGLISVGFTGVDATEATGTGVILYAGDTYSLEVNNLNLIWIDSTVSGEGVRYTYFT